VHLVLEDIIKRYGSFTLSASGMFLPGVHLISGRVGSGKTTLAQITAGVLDPDSGSILYSGIEQKTLSLQYPEYHVTGSSLAREAASYGVEPGPALSLAGLDGQDARDPLSLSRGELKRFHLACLSLRTWDLLVLDEPFSALDCQEKRRQCRAIEQNRQGIVLVFTHEQHILPRTDYLWEINGGRLDFLGRLPDAVREWRSPPAPLKGLLDRGVIPANLTEEDLLEVVCRTRD
jgi:energy-coupling factor transport system ATP-binding protein